MSTADLRTIVVTEEGICADPIDYLASLRTQPAFVFSRRSTADRSYTFTYAAFDSVHNSVFEGDDEGWTELLDAETLFTSEKDPRLGPFQGGAALVLAHDAPQEQDGVPRYRIIRLREFLVIDSRRRCCHFVRQVARAGADLRSEVEAQARLALAKDGPRVLRHRRAVDTTADWQVDVSREVHAERVGAIQRRLRAGSLRQVVLSIGLRKATRASAWHFFRRIVDVNPAPQAFFVRAEGFSLAGSSPLMLTRASAGWAEVETDAGTRPVVADEAENQRAARDLLSAAKDRMEQGLMVDATRADVLSIAEGEVADAIPLELRRFSHVMHLYTVFRCELKRGMTPGTLLKILTPSPAVVGLPKADAAAMTRQLEGVRRGPYGGVVALVGCDGSVDACVVLRSAWFRNGEAFLRSGGGIVAESDAGSEYDECLQKARAVFAAVALAEQDLIAANDADELAPD